MHRILNSPPFDQPQSNQVETPLEETLRGRRETNAISLPMASVLPRSADGRLDRLAANVPSPNGIAFNAKTNQFFVAVTRNQQVWRLLLMADGQPSKTGLAIQLSGGYGPDGIELGVAGGIVLAHPGVGVWRFDARFLPTHLIAGPSHSMLTNIAFRRARGRDAVYD
jgi:gluconolactonase